MVGGCVESLTECICVQETQCRAAAAADETQTHKFPPHAITLKLIELQIFFSSCLCNIIKIKKKNWIFQCKIMLPPSLSSFFSPFPP